MAYEKIGTIKDISEIEFDKNIIVNGSVNKIGWMWHMGGMFKKKGNEIILKNEHGMVTKVVNGDVGLTILRKIS